jgi:hypothetical protein
VNPFIQLLVNVILTLIIETTAMALILRRKKAIYASLAANLLTCPALNFILILVVLFGSIDWYLPALIIGEISVVAVEFGVYRYLELASTPRCFLLSLGLNALSFTCGLLLQSVFGLL